MLRIYTVYRYQCSFVKEEEETKKKLFYAFQQQKLKNKIFNIKPAHYTSIYSKYTNENHLIDNHDNSLAGDGNAK